MYICLGILKTHPYDTLILIFEMELFCLVGSKVEVDFLAGSFGFASLVVVFFPLDIFVSDGENI